MFIPIFNHNAGIHQWDIQVINLIKWTKVSYMFLNLTSVSKVEFVLDCERHRNCLHTYNIHYQTFHLAPLSTNICPERQD